MKLYSPKKNNTVIKRNNFKSSAFQTSQNVIKTAGLKTKRRVLPEKVTDRPSRQSFTKLISKRINALTEAFQKTVEELIKDEEVD